MDARSLYDQAVDCWTARVRAIGPSDWGRPTPCVQWTVRDLVNHVVSEDRWTVPLMGGARLDDVGQEFDGDLLGDSAVEAALDSARAARTAVSQHLPNQGAVHLSYGQESAEEYVRQLAADHLIHAWDLAVATDGDPVLPTELVEEVAVWFADRSAA